MIRPERCFSIEPSACCVQRCAPVRLVRITASQSSSFMRSARVSRDTPALFTSMSSRPNFASTCWNPAFTCAGSETSIGTASASPPAAWISAASSPSFSTFRAATATFAPASTSEREVARPIPCDAPVTNATLSFSENILRLGLGCFRSRLLNLFERRLKAGGIINSDAAN